MDLIAPSLVFSALVSTAYGAGFHLVFGGDRRQLVLYLCAAWIGFTLGHVLGEILDINVLNIGPVHTLAASIGCWIALGAARWLSVRRAA